GVYRVDAPVTVKAGVQLRADGATLRLGQVHLRVLQLQSDAAVHGLAVDSDGLAANVVRFAPGSRGADLLDSEVYGGLAEHSGVVTAPGVVGASIRDCHIHHVRNGIHLANGPARIVVEGTRIANWTTRGIRIQGDRTAAASDIAVRGNRVGPNVGSGQSRQPVVALSTGRVHRRISIAGNIVTGRGTSYEDPTRPGTADQISVNDTRGVQIIGNVSRLGGERGINVTGSSQVVVARNRVSSADAVGIGIGSTAEGNAVRDVVLRGNTVLNSGQSRSGGTPDESLAGIRLTQVHEALVTQNVLADGQRDPTQKYGVSVDRSSNVSLTRNSFSGNAVMEVFDSDGNTGLRRTG
ncbi:MAG: right-handed parallel beta-helix repeat-containing protein, partial [Nocardioidaceae bacterium]